MYNEQNHLEEWNIYAFILLDNVNWLSPEYISRISLKCRTSINLIFERWILWTNFCGKKSFKMQRAIWIYTYQKNASELTAAKITVKDSKCPKVPQSVFNLLQYSTLTPCGQESELPNIRNLSPLFHIHVVMVKDSLICLLCLCFSKIEKRFIVAKSEKFLCWSISSHSQFVSC